jgi:cell division protein FtsL
MGTLSKEWAISMAFSLALLLAFGLGLVWVNIERVDLAYELNKIQRQIDEMETLSAKLEVERNTLVTPARLRELAKERGLGPARPGQIRRVAANGEIEASPLVATAVEPSKPTAKAAAKPAADTAKAAKPAAVEAAKAAPKPAAADAGPKPKPFKPAAAGEQ